MGDPRDLGLVTQVRSPHAEEPTIYLYEAVPGGIGLSERLWQRHDELIAGAADLIAACDCDGGCPACTGPRLEPGVDAKALALAAAGRARCRRAAGPGMTLESVASAGGATSRDRLDDSGATRAGAAERWVRSHGRPGRPDGPLPHRPIRSAELADRLATTLDGEVVRCTGRPVRPDRATGRRDPRRS